MMRIIRSLSSHVKETCRSLALCAVPVAAAAILAGGGSSTPPGGISDHPCYT
jgi:hypothetical protein